MRAWWLVMGGPLEPAPALDGVVVSLPDRDQILLVQDLTGDEACTGGQAHGDLAGRSREEIGDLEAFLQSL